MIPSKFLIGLLLIGIVVGLGGIAPAYACGASTNCTIGSRSYRIALPDGHDGETPIGAIIYAHGYKGSAKGVMGNKSLRGLAESLGVALIAAQSVGAVWDLPGSPGKDTYRGIDEFAYFDALIEDAATRFSIDPSKLLMTGFSAGGMMVWELACKRSQSFAGFAPISGTFWQPEPRTCPSPAASVIHIHGNRDTVVPLTGRRIADARQGNVQKVLTMYQRHGDFGPAEPYPAQNLNCTRRKNDAGKFLDFCLFEGGHEIRTEYVRHAWEQVWAR